MFLKGRPIVGLDIGSRVVKAVQLRKNGKEVQLEKFGLAEVFPPGARASSPEEHRRAKVTAIKRALERGGITARQAVTGVRGESVIVRYIPMPDMTDEELKNALRWQAEEHIVFRMDEVNMDWSVVGKSGNGEQKPLDVLLVCAQKTLINDHVSMVKEAGLAPEIVDVDSFAFLNCFELNYQPNPNEAIALINFGGEITGICVYCDGKPRFSRDVTIGGNTITTALHQRLGITLAQAEDLKIRVGVRQHGDAPEQDSSASPGLVETIRSSVESATGEKLQDDSSDAMADRVANNSLNNLVTEIRRSIQFYEDKASGPKVSRLVLGGGSSRLNGIEAFIQHELQLPVEIIDPLRRIPMANREIDGGLLRDNSHMLSVGIGLALRKVLD